MGCKSSTETKEMPYTGILSLTDPHLSTAVSDGGRKIKCITTKSCTNYSDEVFTNRDDLHVTVRVEKRMGDRVMVGLVVADKLDKCGSYTCGEKEIDGSIGCGTVDGGMILRKGGPHLLSKQLQHERPDRHPHVIQQREAVVPHRPWRS